MTICISPREASTVMRTQPRWVAMILSAALSMTYAAPGRADTVASLLGNFTINQYCGLRVTSDAVAVHYVVIFGQLPALRELHIADTDGDGVTSQTERDAYVARLAPQLAQQLEVRLDGESLPLHTTHWASSLPTEQGGFSLRLDMDLAADVPKAERDSPRILEFRNLAYPGRMGWHEIVVESASGLSVFDTNAYNTSLTGALSEALQSLPSSGPLDERSVHLQLTQGAPPANAKLIAPRPGAPQHSASALDSSAGLDTAWLARQTRALIDAISKPQLDPSIAFLALLGALLLGAVHALSPGHGKTIVGAYLIGSRGTPRHALFLGLTVTVTHTVGVFLLGFATLYASRFVVPERLFPLLSLLSALLVLGMGILLLFQRGLAARRALAGARASAQIVFQAVQPAMDRAHDNVRLSHVRERGDGSLHSHGGGKPHSHLPPGAAGENISWRSLLALGISGGLVPCPSALVLLLAAVALNKTGYGMLLVLSFSIGLAITLTIVGMMFLYARNRFRRPNRIQRWGFVLPVLSAATITLVGIALCFGALRSLAI